MRRSFILSQHPVLLFVSSIEDARLVEGPPIQLVDEGAALDATPTAVDVALAYPSALA